MGSDRTLSKCEQHVRSARSKFFHPFVFNFQVVDLTNTFRKKNVAFLSRQCMGIVLTSC